MYCRWVNDKDGRYYVPQCWGGLYHISGCYCERPSQKTKVERLEKRVQELEEKLSHHRGHGQ